MNLRDRPRRAAYAALQKKGLVTRLGINTLNLLNDSEQQNRIWCWTEGFGKGDSCA